MVMSMKKGRQGAAAYYTDCMDSQGLNRVDDYYAGSGKEPPGEWYVGAAGGDRTTDLGIEDGQLFSGGDPDRFHNLINGYDAEGGKPLVQNAGAEGRVAFHDLTFSAPKSVSVVWSQADDKLRERIEQAQRAACRRALDELSSYSVTRAGKAGHQVKPAALRAAMFPHGSSRENDPQLHSHCVVFNLAEAGDGKVRTLEIRPALAHAGAATLLYRAELAWEMRKAGFEIEAADGNFEIKGVPDPVLQHFSKRREQIKERVAEQLEKMGLDPSQASKNVFDVAAVESRSAKGELSRDELLDMWHEQGRELGFSDDQVQQLLNEGALSPVKELADEELRKEAEEALKEICETRAVFNSAHLTTGVAARLMGRASPEQIKHAVELVKPDLLVTNENNRELYTTKEQLATERHLRALARKEGDKHVLETGTLPQSLTHEQRAAAEGVLRDRRMCSVIEGTAGAGKTYTVSTIANAYKAEGYNVTALATSWAAAQNLQGAAGLQDGAAIAAFASEVRRGNRKLSSRDLLVVDEAGQSGIRDLRDVLAAADKAGAKVVLLGDTKQQKAVSAGDGLRLVADEVGSWRLDEIRRQRDAGDREAVKRFFDGQAEEGLTHHDKAGHVHVETDRQQQLQRLVDDWQQAREHARAVGQEPSTLIVAHDRATARELNERAHQARKEAGELGQDVRLHTMDCASDEERLEFSEGDEVVFRVNVRDEGVTNRTRGTLEKIDDDGALYVRVQPIEGQGEGHLVRVDPSDERWNHRDGGLGLQHGYAWTAFSAQGQTVERCFVADSARYARDSAGVAMSRHKGQVDLYVSHADRHADAMRDRAADDWQPAAEYTREEVLKRVADTWSRRSEKANAMDHRNWKEASTGLAPDMAAEDAIERANWQAKQSQERAKEIAAAAIERAKNGRQAGPLLTNLPPAAPVLKAHQRDDFEVQVPPPTREDAHLALQRLSEKGVDVKTLRHAHETGMLRVGPGGEPMYAGQRPDGAAMRLIDEEGAEQPPGRAKVLRDRFTPVLDGDPQRVVVASNGLTALQLRSLQHREHEAGRRGEPDTVVVARSTKDLAGEHVQERLGRASEVVELSSDEERAIAAQAIQAQQAAQAAQEAAARLAKQEAERQAQQQREAEERAARERDMGPTLG